MSKTSEKAVSMPELFYDLIYAYAIGRMAKATATPVDGRLPLINLFEFLMMFLVFWTLWSYQTVFANRFYTGNLRHNIFLFINMFMIIYLSTTVNSDFAATKLPFQLGTGLLLISAAIQYWLANHLQQNPIYKSFVILLLSSGIVTVGSIFPTNYSVAFSLFLLAVGAAALGPIFLIPNHRAAQFHFDHLTERMSLFTLLIFGEAITTVAEVLTHGITVLYISYFIIIVIMFIGYFQVYEYGIDREAHTTGMAAILLHYPLLVGELLTFTLLHLWLEDEFRLYTFSLLSF